MKSKRTIISTFLRCATFTWLLLAGMAVDAALVADYRMDAASWNGAAGEVLDSSGNAYHGTAISATTTSGLVCQAADLTATGTGDYLDIDYRALDGLDDFTIGIWVKSANAANKALISAARAGGGAQANELIFWFSSATRFYFYLGAPQNWLTTPNIWNDTWHHVVWVRDGTSNCLYIDGISMGCRTLTTATLSVDPGGFIVGQEQDSVGGGFSSSQSVRGEVDELVIFDDARSAAEVNSIYTNNLAGSNWDGAPRTCALTSATASIIAEYRMDEVSWNGTAGEVADSSGNGFNGVAQSATTTSALLCEGADLSGTSEADYLDLDSSVLDGRDDFTLSMWYRSANDDRTLLLSAANASEDKEVHWELRNAGQFRPEIKDDRDGDIDIVNLDDNAWHHLAWTREGTTNCFYVDGNYQDCNSLTTGTLNVDPTGFIVGQEHNNLGYDFQNNHGIEGLVDELYVFDGALTAAEIAQIRTNNLAGSNWDGTTRLCSALTPRAAYYFDEPSWSGATDEVQDSSGNAYHGTAVSATTSSGLVCQAADLSAVGTGDYLDLDYRALDGIDDFTIGIWVRSSNAANKALLSAARSGQANELLFWFSNATRFNFYLGSTNSWRDTPNIWDNTWHHVVWVRDGTSNCLYIDGVSRGCRTLTSAARSIDPGGFIIGQEQDNVGGAFSASQDTRGELDELVIFDDVFSAAEVSAIYANNLAGLSWDGAARSCAAPGVSSFTVIHDNAGIYCASERIGVRAIDGAGATMTSYSQNITLDTGTNQGDWTLDTGGGFFDNGAADDGRATYTFDISDNGEAWFNLNYQDGAPSLDVDAFETLDSSIRDNDTEGSLTFSPTGFTVTANALPLPPSTPVTDPIVSNTAGGDFDVHLAAFGTTDDDPVCGVIEDYTGLKSVNVWQDWVDPGSGSIAATLNGTVAGPSLALANTAAVTFVAGQAVVAAKYKDVGRLRLNFSESTLSGATDSFVSRPADIQVISVTTVGGDANLGAVVENGPSFVAAGEPFVVTADVLDAEGDRVENFGNESAAEVLVINADNLQLPPGGLLGSSDTGLLDNGDAFVTTATDGRFRNSTVFFDEVGVVQLRASISGGSYLGTGNVLGQLTGNVGRFYPDHFEISSSALAASCGSFAYMSAPHIGIQADIYARTVAGATTQNYDASGMSASVLADVEPVAEHLDGGIDLGSRVSIAVPNWQLGRVSLNVANAEFVRLVTPDGPYEVLDFGLKVDDPLDSRELDILDMNADTTGLCTLGNNCTAQRIDDLDIVYGRLALLPALGPETEPLDMGIEAQIFSNNAFVSYPSDQCTTYIASDTTLGNYRDNLQDGETAVIGPAVASALVLGRDDPNQPLRLSAPGVGDDGIVEVELTAPAWLLYPWSGGLDISPTADAAFGRYRGHDRIIFWQQDP